MAHRLAVEPVLHRLTPHGKVRCGAVRFERLLILVHLVRVNAIGILTVLQNVEA
jgi:hypothetical protein